MTKHINYYRDTPIGQQMTVFLNKRNNVRHTTTLFPRSLQALFGMCKKNQDQQMTSNRDDEDGGAHHRVAHI